MNDIFNNINIIGINIMMIIFIDNDNYNNSRNK